jgi:hypothetical protein
VTIIRRSEAKSGQAFPMSHCPSLERSGDDYNYYQWYITIVRRSGAETGTALSVGLLLSYVMYALGFILWRVEWISGLISRSRSLACLACSSLVPAKSRQATIRELRCASCYPLRVRGGVFCTRLFACVPVVLLLVRLLLWPEIPCIY